MADVRVLTWNLFHGRDGFPGLGASWQTTILGRPAKSGDYVHLNRKLIDEMAALVRTAAPTVAMLQEVPPGAIARIAHLTRMEAVGVRTGPLIGPLRIRAALGAHNPDVWRTHEGNANVLLVGDGWRIDGGSVRKLRLNPPLVMARAARRARLGRSETLSWAAESRRLIAASIVGPGGERILAACTHCTTSQRVAHVEILRARNHLVDWAGDLPILFGGDLNVGPDHPAVDLLTHEGFEERVPGVGIDHIFTRGLVQVSGRRWRPQERDLHVRLRGGVGRIRLSDHDPVEGLYRLW